MSRQLVHPYTPLAGARWLRGNLHTHTNRSDGLCTPQQVIDDYAARGYDFLAITDHDRVWTDDDCAALDAKGMTLIAGNEITDGGPHLLHIHPTRLIDPAGPREQVIQNAAADRGFVVVNHPNWQERFDHCPLPRLLAWTDYIGMEIYNGVIGRLDGSPYATNKWDMLLAAGRRIWGLANDDSHAPMDVGLGWNMVCAADRSAAAIVDALAAGRFYATTGVVIRHIEVDGLRVRLETKNAQRIVALRQTGTRFAVADAPHIEVQVPEDAQYVRFECWGPAEQFAWTQPMFMADN